MTQSVPAWAAEAVVEPRGDQAAKPMVSVEAGTQPAAADVMVQKQQQVETLRRQPRQPQSDASALVPVETDPSTVQSQESRHDERVDGRASVDPSPTQETSAQYAATLNVEDGTMDDPDSRAQALLEELSSAQTEEEIVEALNGLATVLYEDAFIDGQDLSQAVKSQVLDAVLPLVENSSSAVREAAVWGLSYVAFDGTETNAVRLGVAQAVLPLVADESAAVRGRVHDVLVGLLFSKSNAELQLQTLRTLGGIVKTTPVPVEERAALREILVEALALSDDVMINTTTGILIALDSFEQTAQTLAGTLSDERAPIRVGALKGLAIILAEDAQPAGRHLSETVKTAVVAAVSGQVTHTNAGVRASALWALTYVAFDGTESNAVRLAIAQTALPLVADADAAVRGRVNDVLVGLLFSGSNGELQLQTLRILHGVVRNTPVPAEGRAALREVLVEALSLTDAPMVTVITATLIALDSFEEAANTLATALRDERTPIRLGALRGLITILEEDGRVGGRQLSDSVKAVVLSAVIGQLKSSGEAIREAAVWALAYVAFDGTETNAVRLQVANAVLPLVADPAATVRGRANDVLVGLLFSGSNTTLQTKTLQRLDKLLSSSSFRKKVPPEEKVLLIEILTPLTESPNKTVRTLAVRIIQRLSR